MSFRLPLRIIPRKYLRIPELFFFKKKIKCCHKDAWKISPTFFFRNSTKDFVRKSSKESLSEFSRICWKVIQKYFKRFLRGFHQIFLQILLQILFKVSFRNLPSNPSAICLSIHLGGIWKKSSKDSLYMSIKDSWGNILKDSSRRFSEISREIIQK